VLLLVLYVLVQLGRALPRPQLIRSLPSRHVVAGPLLRLPWPAQGEAVLDLQGVGSLGSAGRDAPLPLASVTKMMTALIVLRDHPITPGTQGPTITVTQQDVAAYQSDLATDQSVAPVAVGERLTEFQALQGLLLPSANNFADMLAVWDAGSVSAFVAQMNDEAKALDLTGTHYVDPSGFDPANVGTPSDQVLLAETALANTTFAGLVSEARATLPVAGTVRNVDDDLGQDGIIGVKTGSESAAGGCFVFAARREVDGLPATLVGAILGEQGPTPLTSALTDAEQLAASAFHSLRAATLFSRGQALAHVVVPWARPVPIVTDKALKVIALTGTKVAYRAHYRSPSLNMLSGSDMGTLSVSVGQRQFSVRLVAVGQLRAPAFSWRMTNV
jgi:serine-type D-Ala-D-Ala carboxypeptidase (penicillin-binding protein 5/6)